MKRNTMIAASYPTIITSGGNPRVNKELINNGFLKKYVLLLAELLKVKRKISEIKIVYIGGYNKEENRSRAKLYISAYNYYLNSYGYDSLSKNNLTILDEETITEKSECILKCDLLFLGIGCDKTVASLINTLEKKGIFLNKIINEKNILVSSICSGSVMSAKQIYGGAYDSFYYGKETIKYPYNLKSLNFNPVTMETDFCPNDALEEQNKIFIKNYLKPDSKQCVFFACKPNSFFLINEEKIYSYGEIFLFLDEECLRVEGEEEKSEVTKLVLLVNSYNKLKNRKEIISNDFVKRIKKEIEDLKKIPIETENIFEKETILQFALKEQKRLEEKKIQSEMWKNNLKIKINQLFSEENLLLFSENYVLQEKLKKLNSSIIESYNIEISDNYIQELYLKMNLLSLIKSAYLDYDGYYSDFVKDLYDLLIEYLSLNDLILYYALEVCGFLFTNQELKQLLNELKIKYETVKRPQQIINASLNKRSLFRKEWKDERS